MRGDASAVELKRTSLAVIVSWCRAAAARSFRRLYDQLSAGSFKDVIWVERSGRLCTDVASQCDLLFAGLNTSTNQSRRCFGLCAV